MKNRHNFTREELKIIHRCNTPEKVDNWLRNEICYNYEDDGKALQSFRRVVRSGRAYCLEGALAAAAILSQYGYAPTIVCMESSKTDHNIFIYNNSCDGIRSVSKGTHLHGLDEIKAYKTMRSLVIAYRKHVPGLRGWTILDLRQFKNQDWITAEEDLWFIEKKLYAMEYHALFPENGRRKYLSPDEDGKRIIWL